MQLDENRALCALCLQPIVDDEESIANDEGVVVHRRCLGEDDAST
jgi:hypothetical protein